MNPSEGFITIAKAAEALGLSERHARRLADKLPDICRTPAGHSPLKVSLVDLAALAGKTIDAGPMPGASSEPAGPAPDVSGQDSAALIAHLQGEVTYLREALSREQSIAMSATTDAQELRRRLLALAPLEKPSEGNSTNPGVSISTEGGQNAAGEAQASQAGHSGSEALPWWRRLFGAGSGR